MKKTIFSLIAVTTISIFLNSCKLIDKLTKFDVDYSTSFTIPATLGIGLLPDFNTLPITTNSDQTFTQKNTRADLLEEVLLKKIKLTITSPSGKKFDFLQSADVYITAPGLPKIKVASISGIDDATVGSSIELTPSAQDLKEYLKKSELTISVSTTTDKIVTEDVAIRVDATFFVDAKILGV